MSIQCGSSVVEEGRRCCREVMRDDRAVEFVTNEVFVFLIVTTLLSLSEYREVYKRSRTSVNIVRATQRGGESDDSWELMSIRARL